MIYLFTWNNPYLVREKTLSWKKAYTEKYGDFNFVHLKDIKNVDNNIINQEILAEGFMWEKKLIIIDDFPLKSTEKNEELNEKQVFIDSLLNNIPENNIVIFSSANPDKRSKFFKNLKKIATKIEEFNTTGESDLFNIISSKYWNKIDNSAINLIIRYKSGNLAKIISEIEKLLILNDKVTDILIKENIFPELEESIFQLVDDIMNENISNAISKIEIILSQTSVYAFYNNLLANLRVLVFIKNLKVKNIPNIPEVLDLKNRAFLATKTYKIGLEKLNNLYIWLVKLDKKMKSGSMIWSEEDVFKYEIEKEVLKIWL